MASAGGGLPRSAVADRRRPNDDRRQRNQPTGGRGAPGPGSHSAAGRGEGWRPHGPGKGGPRSGPRRGGSVPPRPDAFFSSRDRPIPGGPGGEPGRDRAPPGRGPRRHEGNQPQGEQPRRDSVDRPTSGYRSSRPGNWPLGEQRPGGRRPGPRLAPGEGTHARPPGQRPTGPVGRRPPDWRPPDRPAPDQRPRDQRPRDQRPPDRGFPGRAGRHHGPLPWVAGHRAPDGRQRPVSALETPDLLGPGEELVAGRRPVEEAFAAERPALRLLVVPQRRGPLEKLVLHATRLRIPVVEVEGGSLTSLAGFDGHQGIALVVEPRQFASLDDMLARALERGEPAFVLVLDSLEDPQNVGTLLRSAEAAGVHGVVFPVRRQAPLTPAAVKASAGAVEHLLLCPVDDLGGALAELHGRGLRVAGSDAEAALTARQSDLRGPLAIVVGSEGQGLGPAIRRRCDLLIRIPMRGVVGSLNAAVAGSILLFEAVAQRDPDGPSRSEPRGPRA